MDSILFAVVAIAAAALIILQSQHVTLQMKTAVRTTGPDRQNAKTPEVSQGSFAYFSCTFEASITTSRSKRPLPVWPLHGGLGPLS